MLSIQRLVEISKTLFEPNELPRHFTILDAVARARAGEDVASLARQIRSPKLAQIAASETALFEVLKIESASYEAERERIAKRAKASLGQLLIGALAEKAFEQIYRDEMHSNELRLEDEREAGSDTDYRVLNGSSRPVFRMNIEFHGSLFRNAQDLVGLNPNDCFALATYKIFAATQKQEAEHLPYIFVIIGVPHLTGEIAGDAIPEETLEFATLLAASKVPGKRRIEDRIISQLTDREQTGTVGAKVAEFRSAISRAEWRVLSARKADKLVRERLFERVFAVRVRGFTRNYRNAELDMHFSISEELTPLKEFLLVYKEHGLPGLATRLERGTI
jgi:hypothetical protein